MSDTPSTPVDADGIVLYADGSCKGSNPGGFLGFGVHGYAYKTDDPKKGTGNPKYVPTTSGYLEKTYPNVKPVTMVKYFDVIGAPGQSGSNNTAEVLAATAAIELAAKYQPKNVLIKSDSKYVVCGINEWSANWVKRGWRKPDGSPIPNAAEWRDLLASIAKLNEVGAKMEVRHVKGHSTHLGNIIADKLADIGSEMSKSGKMVTSATASAPEGYWKPQEERSPLLAHRSFMFSTMLSTQLPGEYYLTTLGKSDELPGKAHVDTSYAVVQLKQPEPVIELLRKRQNELVDGVDSLVLGRLDRLYASTVADDLVRYGEHCLSLGRGPGRGRSKHLFFVTEAESGEPLTEELDPPMLAMRTMVAFATLKEILEHYKTSTKEEQEAKRWCVQDVTEHFFKKTTKKVGKDTVDAYELKKEFGITQIKTAVKVNAFGRMMDISMTFGLDLPPRNNLKRIGDVSKDLGVFVVCIQESDQAYRYHTIIRSDDDWSIWSSFYSNLMMFPKEAK